MTPLRLSHWSDARRGLSAAILLFLLFGTVLRCPAPVIETPDTTPTPERPSSQPSQSPEEKPASKSKHKREEPEAKPKKQTAVVAKPAKSLPASAAGGFSGTWKGRLTDGSSWTIVIDSTEANATASGQYVDAGPTHIKGNTISWNHLTVHQNNAWSLTLQADGRRADVIAYHISGNLFGTFEKIK